MNDPVGIAARAAAQQLQAEAGPGLVAEVEAVLATRESPAALPQYVDPIALVGLIVAIAGLAWTVYTDLKERAAQLAAEVVARTVRVTRQDQGHAVAPDHIVELIVTETIRAAAAQEHSEDQNLDESPADVPVNAKAVASVAVRMQAILP